MSYDALLLDHDGVLVRLADRSVLRTAARQALRDVGVEDPDPATVDRLSVGVSREDLAAITDERGVEPTRLWRARDDHLARALRESARNGEKDPYDDVETLSGLDLPLGIASNNQHRIVESILTEHGLADLFDAVVGRQPRIESLGRKKPNPLFLERATERLTGSNPLYVGDKGTDVLAAERAGLDVAFIRRDHNADLSPTPEPTYEIDGLGDVTELLEREDK